MIGKPKDESSGEKERGKLERKQIEMGDGSRGKGQKRSDGPPAQVIKECWKRVQNSKAS